MMRLPSGQWVNPKVSMWCVCDEGLTSGGKLDQSHPWNQSLGTRHQSWGCQMSLAPAALNLAPLEASPKSCLCCLNQSSNSQPYVTFLGRGLHKCKSRSQEQLEVKGPSREWGEGRGAGACQGLKVGSDDLCASLHTHCCTAFGAVHAHTHLTGSYTMH